MNDILPQWHDLSDLLPQGCASILDIGCGDGRTLRLCPEIPCRVGIDNDSDAIQRARKNVPGADFSVAIAEQLPFAAASFEAAVSSVALPYADIRLALYECARVLRPGAILLVSFHTWDFIKLLWRQSRANLAGRAFRCYVAVNGMSFHLTGRVFPYPLKPALNESFQTWKGMTRALGAAGFDEIRKLPRPIPSLMARRIR